MSGESLLDEINGRLTATAVRYPESKLFIWSFQKHVQYALKNPSRADLGKLIRKGRSWLQEMMWKHPAFRDDFQRIIEAIDKFKGEHDRQHGEAVS